MRLTVLAGLLALMTAHVGAQVPYGRTPANSQQSAVAPPGVDKNSLYSDVEYISGHEGFDQKRKGQLVVTADGVGFFDNKGKLIFSLQAQTIKDAEHTRDIRDPSVGKKLLFGALAGDRKQDFLTITTETQSTAEGVVFKVKQNSATGLAAKIGFYARKARGEAPGTVTASSLAAAAPASSAGAASSPDVDRSSAAAPPVPTNSASSPPEILRSTADLTSDLGFRLAVGDAQRLGLITDYQEISTSTLAVDLSDKAMDDASTEQHLVRLYSAYRRLSSSGPVPTLVLRHQGLSVGEYSTAGLTKGDWK